MSEQPHHQNPDTHRQILAELDQGLAEVRIMRENNPDAYYCGGRLDYSRA